MLNAVINFDGHTQFKAINTETYTVPEYVTADSPTGKSSGVSPVDIFSSRRSVSGGVIFAAFNDGAGPTALDFQYPLKPGDVIVVSAVSSSASTVKVNGILVFTITGITTTGGVLGVIG